ncbi:MAG: hypothetical protein LBM98_06940 [Oscillospiraceae bacterium]|nr:hypothetical protein [Oscillospiraceae bacterium]
MLRRISPTTYRKCSGGFAMTVRRRAHHGQGKALPPRTARGTTPPLRGTPPKRGIYGGGFSNPATPQLRNSATPQPPSKPIPLLGGVPPQGRGGFPRRTQPPSKPSSLISDIC